MQHFPAPELLSRQVDYRSACHRDSLAFTGRTGDNYVDSCSSRAFLWFFPRHLSSWFPGFFNEQQVRLGLGMAPWREFPALGRLARRVAKPFASAFDVSLQ